MNLFFLSMLFFHLHQKKTWEVGTCEFRLYLSAVDFTYHVKKCDGAVQYVDGSLRLKSVPPKNL
jgi:hypothetical protein